MYPAARWAVVGDAVSRALTLDGLKSLVDHGLAASPRLVALSDESVPSSSTLPVPALEPEHLGSTPPPTHYPSAEAYWQAESAEPVDIVADAEPLRAAQGLARGCHVLLDWPESVDLPTARDWCAEAAERGLCLAAVAWPRHSAKLTMLRWALANGALGALRQVTIGADGGPVELAQAIGLIDWLCGPLQALRLRDAHVEGRLLGGAVFTTQAAGERLLISGERGIYGAGWLELGEQSAALSRWYHLHADDATRAQHFPAYLADTTGRALLAFLTHLHQPASAAIQLLRTVRLADALRESSTRGAIWIDCAVGMGD